MPPYKLYKFFTVIGLLFLVEVSFSIIPPTVQHIITALVITAVILVIGVIVIFKKSS